MVKHVQWVSKIDHGDLIVVGPPPILYVKRGEWNSIYYLFSKTSYSTAARF